MRGEPAIVVEDRKELTYLLCQAAELEHAVMCEYLYAAFSLKSTRGAPGANARRPRAAFQRLGFDPEGPPGLVSGRSKMSFRKNRWAAEISVTVSPVGSGSMVLCRVNMAGNKHYALLSEVADAVGDDAFDDQGVAGAVERLGKWSRLFGRKEVRHLHNVLRVSETVLELGQGVYDNKQGLVVLTTERMFFFEKSMGSETVEEFPLAVINSLSINKKMTGETLKIFSSGNQSEIGSMTHGQGDALVRAYYTAKKAPVSHKDPAGAPTSAAPEDPFRADRAPRGTERQGPTVGGGVRGKEGRGPRQDVTWVHRELS
jgi:hypothetical protein